MISMPQKKTAADFGVKKPTAPKTTLSGKTPTSGHDPAGKKTGATEKKMGSTYDFRKGSKATKPPKKAKPTKAERNNARLEKKRARLLKSAAKKKARAEKKAARLAARAKKRGLVK